MVHKQGDDATELHKAQEVLQITFITHHYSSEIAQPREQSLNLPTHPLAPPFPSIRCYHLDTKFSQTPV
jgi:hypothetical protein